MLVLATSSANPKSLNTTRVSTAGASSLRHATMPAPSVRHLLGQTVGEANDQRAAADGMDGLAGYVLRLDRHAEIEASLSKSS